MTGYPAEAESAQMALPPSRSAQWAAGAAIAATYFYFLIYAEFALLELASPWTDAAPDRLDHLMLALGLGGLMGSVAGARGFRRTGCQNLLRLGFGGCALAAGIAAVAKHWILLIGAAGGSGFALGVLTVSLATSLRPVLGIRRLGRIIGGGTGVAYAVCNLPGIFDSGAREQTLLAAGLVLAATGLPRLMVPRAIPTAVEADYHPAGVLRWVGILLALVWLDSAAFYVIQHTAELQDQTWGNTARLWSNAGVHLGFAVAVGWLIDRGARLSVPAAGFALLTAGCLALATPFAGLASWFYTAGVSVYSVCLVYYPARGARPWLSATVYGVAGWVGSAMGIGMAQDLNRVPGAFLAVAAATILGLIAWHRRRIRTVVLASLIIALGMNSDLAAAADSEPLVQRGREVYIAEGCIHCHSQYLRPTVPGELADAAEASPPAGSPPLFGNRRQGPDLSTAGRRLPSADWHRLHLSNPRAVRPHSRMPAYAYLFAPGDSRGTALVAYLMSLGNPTNR